MGMVNVILPFAADDEVLLQFDNEGQFCLTVEDSFRSLAFTGRTGIGKTKFGIHAAAIAEMKAGYGMLCACPKPDSAAEILGWAKEAGREGDVIIVNPDGKYLFDLLSWLATRYEGEAMVNEAVLMLEEVGELLGRGKFTQQTGDNRFFTDHAQRLARSAMNISLAVDSAIPIDRCLSMIQSLNKEPGR